MAGTIVAEDQEEVFIEQIKKIMSDKMIRNLQKYCKTKQGDEVELKMRRTKAEFNESYMSGISKTESVPETDDTENIFQQDEGAKSETGNTEDNADEEEELDEGEEEEKREPTDQVIIDETFMTQLSQNWPLKCYYKTLKRSIQVTLGSEKVPSKLVPKWRKEVYTTFRKLTSIVAEMNYVYQSLGLSESNIKGSVSDMT